MNQQFKVVNLSPQVQKSKRGLDIIINPLTQKAITYEGKIVAYLPDHLPDGTAEGLVAKLNNDRKIKLPE